jgi:hypothetical protein
VFEEDDSNCQIEELDSNTIENSDAIKHKLLNDEIDVLKKELSEASDKIVQFQNENSS